MTDEASDPPTTDRALERPGCLGSLVQLPFSPARWTAAARASTFSILLPVWLLAILLSITAAGIVTVRSIEQLRVQFSAYDQHFDPLVISGGRISVEGKRVIALEAQDMLFIIDPGQTRSQSSLPPTYAVIRQSQVIVGSPLLPKPMSVPLRSILQTFAPGLRGQRMVIDSKHLVAGLAQKKGSWGPRFALTYGLVCLLVDLISCPLYALIAGVLVYTIWGEKRGLSTEGCYRVALAATAPTLLLNFVYRIVTLRPELTEIPAYAFWPILLIILTRVFLPAGEPRRAELNPGEAAVGTTEPREAVDTESAGDRLESAEDTDSGSPQADG